jgi:hypothetical protein
MSRLDSFIRRLEAQRACLARAADLVASLPGPVLELGLGNGRTYDHLRETMPAREIYVFDRRVAAHPDCLPDADHMIVGEFGETLPRAAESIGAPAVLAHCDYGSGDGPADAALATFVAPHLAPLMAAGGIIVTDQEMRHDGWERLEPPPGVARGRYHIYRAGKS